MRWKTVGQIAKWMAYAVVPGAVGYVAYRHVVRPWLDHRAARKQAEITPPEDPATPQESESKPHNE
jgi:hypothetical protein